MAKITVGDSGVLVLDASFCFPRAQLSVEPQVRELQEQAAETEPAGDAEQHPVGQ